MLLGIGDDAAVIAPPAEPLVWTVDAAVEGVHFRRDLLALDDLGYRATMAAASDLAAMGAAPLGLLAALVLPPWVTDEDLAALAAGQRVAAEALGTAVIGGNLARGAELSITTTALGFAARPLTRAGAQPGDALWMAGPVGLAAAGLAALDRGTAPPDALATAVAAWRRPTARLAAGLRASGVAHAAVDVSDGLARDVGHLARASGVRAVLDAAEIVGDALRAAAALLGRDPLALALHGGEDYALVVALPPGEVLAGFAHIGTVEPLAGGVHVAVRGADGTVAAVGEGGFDHFAGCSAPAIGAAHRVKDAAHARSAQRSCIGTEHPRALRSARAKCTAQSYRDGAPPRSAQRTREVHRAVVSGRSTPANCTAHLYRDRAPRRTAQRTREVRSAVVSGRSTPANCTAHARTAPRSCNGTEHPGELRSTPAIGAARPPSAQLQRLLRRSLSIPAPPRGARRAAPRLHLAAGRGSS